MTNRRTKTQGEHGQVLALFAGSLVVIVLVVGLVIDGSYGLAQRRGAQNSADFAAIAGARIIAEWVTGDTTNGTDANVKAAITTAIAANGASALTFGVAGSPRYVDNNGAIVPEVGSAASYVGNGTIPPSTAGVKVAASLSWRPFFLGVAGVSSWTASAEATAKGGFAAASQPGAVFPAGIALAFFQTYPFCSGPVGSSPSCQPQQLTPGNLNVPGGFGWLKFGCDGYGLGQDPPANAGGCGNDSNFLKLEMGPPSNSFGCCTQVTGVAGQDRIGSLPGNKVDVSGSCDYYINNNVILTVPVWDTAGGTGSNAYYHIIGFAGFQLTGCNGGKNMSGVWRKQFFLGPTTTTQGSTFTRLAVQLVR